MSPLVSDNQDEQAYLLRILLGMAPRHCVPTPAQFLHWFRSIHHAGIACSTARHSTVIAALDSSLGSVHRLGSGQLCRPDSGRV